MSALGLAVLTAVLVWVFWRFVRKWLIVKAKMNKIHGPPTTPLVGNLHQFKLKPEDFFEQLCGSAEMYREPRMIRAWVTSFVPYLCVYGADEAEAILSSQKHLNKGGFYKFLLPWMGEGLLTSRREKWRPQRKMLTPTLHYDILKDFNDVFNHQASIMTSVLWSRAESKQPTVIYEYLTRCALDIICETAMGKTLHCQIQESEYFSATARINHYIHERQRKPWLHPDFLFNLIGPGRDFQKDCDLVHAFAQKVIDERRAKRLEEANNNQKGAPQKRRLAFLDFMLGLEEEGQMQSHEINEQVDTFMFAGHDTTSNGMNWCLFMLSCHPEIQDKVQKEIDSIFGEGKDMQDVGYEDLSSLPMLECCIKEAQRLYPSVPILSRLIEEDSTIVGYEIPAGVEALINCYMIHRDPKHWPDPDFFIPERFLPENSAGRHPFAYLPFAAGGRNCMGQRFAMMEQKTVLSWLLWHYSFRATVRQDQVRSRAEIILRPSQPISFHIIPRREPKYTVQELLDREH